MSTGMIIDGVFASQAIDSSGEILDIEGCDISTLDKDGIANYEHKEGDKKGSGNNGEEIVGKILYAKKVYSKQDCETSREQAYWDSVKVPFVYGMVRLYDGAGHSGAQALAAQIRDHNANNEPILVRFSIEGSTLERDGQRLKSSVARRVALTLKPCNRTAVSGLVEDPRAPEGFEKRPTELEGKVGDILEGLVEKGEQLEHPAYMKLGGVHEYQGSPLVEGDDEQIAKTLKLIIKAKMIKAITAGSYNAAPGSLEGGAALQREDRGLRARMRRAVTEYKPKAGFKKEEFKAFAKDMLPEADDSFMDHFADVAHDYHMRRLKKGEEDRLAPAPASAAKPKKTKKVAAPKTTAQPAPAPAAPVKAAKPKKLTPKDIAPAQGEELDAAMKATHQYKTVKDKKTGESRQELVGLKPHKVQGVEMKGKELARYLGIAEPAPVPLTVRSQPAAPYKLPKGQTKPAPWFDDETGHLHIPPTAATFNMKTGKWSPGHAGGAIKFYIPGHYNPHLHGADPVEGQKKANAELENFKQLMDDPERTKYHDTAMDNWSQAHRLLHAGKTPDELAMHSALFSMLSPNTPVPMHELMYGYLVDSMKHTGIDARSPKFGGRLGEKLSGIMRKWRENKKAPKPDLANPGEFGIYGDWKGRDTGTAAPQHSPEHWARINHAITLGNDQKFDPKNPDKAARQKGMYGSFMLAQDKFGNMAKYAKNHEAFHKLFLEHGPKDPREIVNQLLHHKVEGGKFDERRAVAQKANKPTFEFGGQQHAIDAKYPGGLVIEGLAPKTSRFAVTMSGAGNMWVPDTHMVRYNFGLEKPGADREEGEEGGDEDEGDVAGVDQKDRRTIKSVKDILWNERYHPIMNQLDDYYIKHSPALDHMVKRAANKGWYLHGNTPEEKRRNAAFGAFWKNWSAIKGHEASRGYQTGSSNDYSDHLPFWHAVKHLFKTEEDYDTSLPMRTATIHAAWQKKYGEMGAQYMFMAHLLPQLLASHALRTLPVQIRKFEALTIDLKKTIADEARALESVDDTIRFAGNDVIPGHARTGRGDLALLHENADHFIAVQPDKARDWCHEDLVRLPKNKQNTHYIVTRRPTMYVSDTTEK